MSAASARGPARFVSEARARERADALVVRAAQPLAVDVERGGGAASSARSSCTSGSTVAKVPTVSGSWRDRLPRSPQQGEEPGRLLVGRGLGPALRPLRARPRDPDPHPRPSAAVYAAICKSHGAALDDALANDAG